MRSLKRALSAILILLAAAGGLTCESGGGTAEALRIGSLDQAIGGPVANARVGDFLLKNDQIMVVVEGGRSSRLPLDVGGSVIDMDLVRPEAPYRGGRGLDQLGQISPTANLENARALRETEVRITRSKHGAEVTTSALAGGIFKIVDAIGLLVERKYAGSGTAQTHVYTEHELRPGERLLRVKTTLGFGVPECPVTPADGCNAECDDALYDDDCECPKVPERCAQGITVVDADTLPDGPGRGLLDLLLGDIPRPLGTGACATDADCDASKGETCAALTTSTGGESRVCRRPEQKDAGVFMGDMLIFGGHLGVFVPGTGFDTETDIRRLFDRGQDTLAQPLALDEVYALGDRVSYGYAPPSGKVVVPVFGGPFSMGAVAGIACRHDEPGCLATRLVRFERWIAVGEGDAASAREVIAKARGQALGEARGVVAWASSGEPVSGARVFALKDPRDLPCEGECQAACPLEGVTDEVIAGFSLERLMAENRCRTRGGPYLEGKAGIDTVTRTDLGTDPAKDGDYRMALPPGRYVLVAQHGRVARSELAPVRIEAGKAAGASFLLREPGRVEYAIFDEEGELSPGRVVVGRCLPGKPCATDAECGGGETCQAGACACAREMGVPLELGGERFADGAVAFDETASGQGSVDLPPGRYDLVFAHGPQSSVERATVEVEAGISKLVVARLSRQVDRRGYSAADFHVHAEGSLDSGLEVEERITSYLAEDMDFMSSSDHDVLTRYEPLIEEMGVRDRLGSQVGVEVTTQELGHFIGYPLKFAERDEAGGRVDGNGAPDWRGTVPQVIFDALRALPGGETPVVVEVPHPYSYFDYYKLDPVTLEPTDSVLSLVNPLISSNYFSGDFDAMELMNAKAFDLLRRPTISELRFYSGGLDEILARLKKGEIDEATYQREVYALSTEATRRFLHRTPAEQEAALSGSGAEFGCNCASDGDCSAGRVCDPKTMKCVDPAAPPSEEEEEGEPAGEPPADGLCRAFRGVLDDWFNMLNRGVRRTGVGGSDVHGLYGYEAGCPRTMLRTGETSGPYLTEDEVASAIREGRSVVTNGPMIHFSVAGGEVGDTRSVSPGKPVEISLRVEKASFYDVDRIEVYRNGRLIHWVSACGSKRDEGAEDPHGHPCIRTGDSALVHEETMRDELEGDAWYVAVAMGIDGRSLAPVYSSATLARFGTFEVTQRLYDLIPTLTTLRAPRFPSLFPTFPFAVTNPVWVDVGGDGWSPPSSPPSWCRKGDAGCTNQ